MKWFVLALAFLISSYKAPLHDFHTSILMLNWNKSDETLEASLRVFTDDLESALKTFSKKGNDIVLTKEKDHQALLVDYLESKIYINAGQGKISPTYIGKELENDVCWIYFEWKKPPAFKERRLFLTHKLLLEQFPDQTNIVNYANGSQKASFLLDKSNAQATLN